MFIASVVLKTYDTPSTRLFVTPFRLPHPPNVSFCYHFFPLLLPQGGIEPYAQAPQRLAFAKESIHPAVKCRTSCYVGFIGIVLLPSRPRS